MRGLLALSELQALSLHSNPSLSGTIPIELGCLLALTVLSLDSIPLLSGTIPSQLGGLSALKELHLESNPSLSGTIPHELGNLLALQKLYIYSVPLLEGVVPALSRCVQLRVLDLHNCSLSQLPVALPASLTHLYLHHNPLNSTSSELRSLLPGDLHVLTTSFINSAIVLEPTGLSLSLSLSHSVSLSLS
eukprot:COSAG03_NODE_3966_length_1736_cov_3.196090_1_plen_189_part_10